MKRIRYINLVFSILVMVLLLPVGSCTDKDEYIPYIPVNFTLDLNLRNELTVTGYSELFEYDGFGGVIVVCLIYDVSTPSNSIYYAYDATCTLEISKECTVVNENNGINAVCKCCGSEYSLYSGVPFKGDASRPLKQYNVSLLNNRLHVYN